MALKFYSDIDVPNIEIKNKATVNEIEITSKATADEIEITNKATATNIEVTNLHGKKVSASSTETPWIRCNNSFMAQKDCDIDFGTSNNPMNAAYFSQYYAGTNIDTGYGNNNKKALFGQSGILHDIDQRLTNLGFNEGVVQYTLVDGDGTTQIDWTNCGEAIKNGNIYIGCISDLEFDIHWYDTWKMRIRFVFNNTPQLFKWGIGSFPTLYQGDPYSQLSEPKILLHNHEEYSPFPLMHRINSAGEEEKEFETIGWKMLFRHVGGSVGGNKYTCIPFTWICGTGTMPDIFNI